MKMIGLFLPPLSHIAERALVEHGGILSGGKYILLKL